MIQSIILLIIFFLVIFPLGKYIFNLFLKDTKKSSFFSKLENKIVEKIRISDESMSWKEYGLSLIITNLLMALISFGILLIQNLLPFNQGGVQALNWHTAFNTVISFMTNTDLQSYVGESNLTYLSQMMVITFLMFISAASGISAAIAVIRGLSGNELGNYFRDIIRVILRLLLPLTVIAAIVFVILGVPQTLDSSVTTSTLTGGVQVINRGPIASLEAIKQIGTNGGGFFGANGAHPFENPTILTNFLSMLMMMIIPGSIVVAFGHSVKNKKQGYSILIAMSVLLILSIIAMNLSEHAAMQNLIGNLEGKEIRFGVDGSTLFTSITTAFSTGAVNNMHASMNPLTILLSLASMMLNVIFGGSGSGFINMIVYVIMTVFIAGLMVGRTPEYLGKKIENKEIKLVALNILIPPLIILIPTAIALILPSVTSGLLGSAPSNITEVLYQFTSSAANNGSSLGSLSANSAFWTISTAVVMFIARYSSIFLLLALADSLRRKKEVPQTTGTFRTDNLTFIGLLIFIVIVIGALTFLPALVLGPITEHLMIL